MNYINFNNLTINKINDSLKDSKEQIKKIFNIDILFDNINIILFRDNESYVAISEKLKNVDGIYKKTIHTFYQENNLYVLCHEFLGEEFLIKRILYILLIISLKKNFKKAWLTYGIPTYILNYKKDKEDYDTFRMNYIYFIKKRNMIIPSKDELNSYDDFNYNLLSYLMISYLYEHDKEKISVIDNLDEDLVVLNKTLEYYDNYFKISSIKDSIDDVKNPEEFFDFMLKNFVYGYEDKEGNLHYDLKEIHTNYITNSLETILKNMMGICVEGVKLYKYVFDRFGLESRMFCYRLYNRQNKDKYEMHCAFFYKDNGKWYRFEAISIKVGGIHEYASFDAALKDFLNSYDHERDLIELETIPDNLTFDEFNAYLDTREKYEIKKQD